MENIAHTLAGLLLARGVAELRRGRGAAEPSARFVSLAGWTSVLASNVPDVDLVLTPLTGGRLGYLLHHRGHTHTLLVGLLLGLLLSLAVLGLARWRGGAVGRADRAWLVALGLLGPVLHLGMDAWNVYGVHPFWPLDARWLYGDSVFIVEPLLWVVAAPPLWALTRGRVARGALGLLFLLGLGLPWLAPAFVPLLVRIALAAVGLAVALLAWRLRPSARAWLGLGAFVAVPLVLFVAGSIIRARVEGRVAAQLRGERLLDAALSPWPADPLCWTAVVVTREGNDALHVTRASLALVPVLLPLDDCPAQPHRITAPLSPVLASSDGYLRWEGRHTIAAARLRALAARCDVAAALRFVRAPFVVERRRSLVIGDLRFDRDPALEFAELELPRRPGRCPEHVPGWTPPRQDVLAR